MVKGNPSSDRDVSDLRSPATRIAVVNESKPGIVEITTEALDALMARAGGRKVEPANGGDHEYAFTEHEARKPHPNTMIGRGSSE